jgi:hypothetical protein
MATVVDGVADRIVIGLDNVISRFLPDERFPRKILFFSREMKS